ncbi:MAG: FGGY family carbohydrate kinase, partial [Sphingomonas sp.]
MSDLILVIDEGTTSTRAMLFSPDGRCVGTRGEPLTQHYPQPGWVEHDADEIWRHTLACAQALVGEAGGTGRIAAIGVTNQRETLVFWDKATGEPLAPAIVWQDRRTAGLCRDLREQGHEPMVQRRTGLLFDPYFSASKIAWAMANWPQLREAGDRLAIGTIDSWLIWKLTGGCHVTDATNASRTALYDIGAGRWDAELCDLFAMPMALLPEVRDCAADYGETAPDLLGQALPIRGVAGD